MVCSPYKTHVAHSAQPTPIANLAGYAWPLTNENAIATVASAPRMRADRSPDSSCCGSCDPTGSSHTDHDRTAPRPLSHSNHQSVRTSLHPPNTVPRTTLSHVSRLLAPHWGPFTFCDLRTEPSLLQSGLNWIKQLGSPSSPEKNREQPQLVPDWECLRRISPLLTACKCCI
ncbi:unnamed protein product [Echinostoma caproni]|uniref:C4 n=1 Tax=Echinostoma caproni TaxID=27848 RepID=A0A183BG37_9TREM|nr:unnamed protein product [Echinostoma caproni]